MNYIASLFMLFFIIFTPVLVRQFLLNRMGKLSMVEHKQRYGSLYANVDYYHRPALNYTTLFLGRRLCFAIVLTFIVEYNLVLQVAILDMLSMLLLIYFFLVKPMENAKHNFIHIFNEVSLIFCMYVLFSFTSYTSDTNIHRLWGHKFIGLVGIQVGVNFVILIHHVIVALIKSIQRCYFTRMHQRA